MDSRQSRARSSRRVLVLGLGISASVHALALGSLSFEPVDTSRSAGEPTQVPVPEVLEVSELELMQVVVTEQEPEQVPLDTETRPVIADAAPVPSPEPEAQNAELASQAAGSRASAGTAAEFAAAAAGSAAAPTLAEILEAGREGRTGIAMAPQSPGQRALGDWAPVEAPEAPDPHAGHDHAEDEGSEGMSFWRRVGRTFGIGGDQICRIDPKDGRRVVKR